MNLMRHRVVRWGARGNADGETLRAYNIVGPGARDLLDQICFRPK